MAVDAAGDLVVTDFERDPNAPPGLGVTKWARARRVPADGSAPVPLPIGGLASPFGVAVNAGGDVYVADNNFATVVVLAAGTTAPTLLPGIGDDRKLADVAVGPDGAVYVAYQPGFIRGEGKGGVLKVDERNRRFGKPKHIVLPFDVRFPSGLAVDGRGSVYVVDGTTVWEWTPGEQSAKALPFLGVHRPSHVAVDAAGAVYVTEGADRGRVVVLESGSGETQVLPVDGLRQPRGVAVDATGNVYIADLGNRRLVRVPVA
ncbi:serine/threonine protein kinase [Gordonia araii NBRC 100433]|uniref:Serine/threonine protein kinase n=1 Tax=Gordonia araii NBRC 100433 TaxID=1073574 RepID=G7H562_9ACTN|nr:serine/threonine protein kinase [Gordonia araii NBRC 100433]